MSILHHDAIGVNVDCPSSADLVWWAEQNTGWHSEEMECGVTDYDCTLDRESDDAIIDRYVGNRGYEPEPPDEWFRWGGHPG